MAEPEQKAQAKEERPYYEEDKIKIEMFSSILSHHIGGESLKTAERTTFLAFMISFISIAISISALTIKTDEQIFDFVRWSNLAIVLLAFGLFLLIRREVREISIENRTQIYCLSALEEIARERKINSEGPFKSSLAYMTMVAIDNVSKRLNKMNPKTHEEAYSIVKGILEIIP